MEKRIPAVMPKLKKSEIIWGIILIPAYIIGIPALVDFILKLLETRSAITVSETAASTIPYYVMFVLTVIAFRNFLKESLSILLHNILNSIKAMLLGYCVMTLLSLVVTFAILSGMEVSENPGDVALNEILDLGSNMMIVIMVLLTPLIEETIFRGVVFGALYEKHPKLAYAVSWVTFGCLPLIQYAIIGKDISLMLFALEYIPSTFGLCWCYKKSGTVFAPMLLHAIINFISIKTLGAM